jgi:long-chain acyl-CoA synthetase
MLTVADPLRHARRVGPGRTAVVCGDETVDFRTLHDRAARLVAGLRRLGVQRGDRVAVLALNCHRYLEAYLAIPAGGMVVVPLNTRLAEAEVRAILQDAEPRVLITDRRGSELGGLAAEVEHVVELPGGYDELLAAGAADTPAELGGGADAAEPVELGEGIDETDLAALFYTGGTTGRSKGVMLTHRNLVANAFHKTLACRFDRDDVLLAVGPLFHVAGTAPLLGLAWLTAAVVMLPRFDPAEALDLIERHGVTATLPVPTMVAAMVDEQRARPRDVSSLRLLGHAGSPIATEVVRRAHATFPQAELAQFYGATETAPIVTCLPHEERELDGPRQGSCGQPVPGVAVKIIDPGGRTLGPGEVGEVAVRGPNVMAGYWRNPEATAAVLVDGWYRTGDLGHQDRDAHLFLVDRLKDMIVSGGENVYSVEVEDVLARHPAVLEAAVFGVPDERWGEAVHAVVVVRPDAHAGNDANAQDGTDGTDGTDGDANAGIDAEALAAELEQTCRAEIAGFKVPKRIEIRTEPLPKSGPGKILKRALRAPYWEGHDVAIG